MPTLSISEPGLVADTLIVSDIHLGLPASRPLELLQFMERWSCERVILLGDVFNDLHFKYLCRDAYRLLDFWHQMVRRSFCELVWIKGNHDRHLDQDVGQLLGVSGVEDYRWRSGGRQFLALHGDRFDPTINRFKTIPTLLAEFNSWAQRRCGMDHAWADRFDLIHERFGQLAKRMPLDAAALAKSAGCDAVICGHTHRSHQLAVASGQDRIDYLNAGAWVGRPGNFITVTDGVATIDCHP